MGSRDDPHLADLGRRLRDRVFDYASKTGRLFVLEATWTARTAGKRIVGLLACLLLVSLGGLLLFLGLSFLVGKWLGDPWRGFVLVGLVVGGSGVVGAWLLSRRLNSPDLRFPETRRAVREDMQWFGNGDGKS